MDFGFRPVRKFPFLFAQLTHFLENVKSVLVMKANAHALRSCLTASTDVMTCVLGAGKVQRILQSW